MYVLLRKVLILLFFTFINYFYVYLITPHPVAQAAASTKVTLKILPREPITYDKEKDEDPVFKKLLQERKNTVIDTAKEKTRKQEVVFGRILQENHSQSPRFKVRSTKVKVNTPDLKAVAVNTINVKDRGS